MNSTDNKLPDLQNTLLDSSLLDQLLHDIANCTEVLEIIPKFNAGYVGQGSVTLDEARALLLARSVKAIQIRYQYQESQWWDTIMLAGDQFRLVRIQHDFQ